MDPRYDEFFDPHGKVFAVMKQECYKARDAFYACIERETKKPIIEPATGRLLCPGKCTQLEARYHWDCCSVSPDWVLRLDREYCEKMKKKEAQRPVDKMIKKEVQRPLDKDDPERGPKSLLKGIRIIDQVKR
ncbi:hypothetical protein C5167_001785 [Papaver somniferum]|uniref:Uncharacterized protein n=1 Tax=Papaver somniferum TaxID=3469 RepID=A0A4Y7KW05_PAPSO|nr:uncharacterized protein LOC113311368 [Papaver somniferum]RZC76095.1 hypothetical protein C5167_001785 [Papaver somniferum]